MIKQPETLTPIANARSRDCFGCGTDNPNGLQMSFFTDRRQVYSFLEVPAHMVGWKRIVHGGVITTILDEVMAWAAIYLFRQLGVTQSITIDFKKPVFSGARITAVAGVSQKFSDTSVEMSGKLYDADEALCAQATGRFKVLKPETAIRMGILGREDLQAYGGIFELDDETS